MYFFPARLFIVVLQITLKFSSFKKQAWIISQFSWVRKPRASELRGSGTGSLMRVHSRCQLKLQSSKGLIGTKGFISKMAQLHDCWLEASVYYRLLTCSLHTLLHGSFIELLKCPHHMVASFPHSRRAKEKARRKPQCFYNYVLKVVYYHFHFI